MIKEPGYRLNVGLIILNDKGKLLLCKRKNVNSWQFPQGGIDSGETPYKAAKRELFEEVGIKANSVSLLSSINDWVKYEIPKKSRRNRFLKKKIIGQKQKWYMFKLKKDVIISFDNDPDNEFEEFKWVSYWYPLYVIIKFKENVYREVLNELRIIYCKEVLNDLRVTDIFVSRNICRSYCRNVWDWGWNNNSSSFSYKFYKSGF